MGTRLRNMGNRIRISLLVVLVIFCSCLKDAELSEHYIFTIPNGDHNSVRTIEKFDQSLLTFAFKFDESAIYNHYDNDQYDYNKLLGFTLGLDPHVNSARIAWRWNIERTYVEIAAYSYVDGVRDMHLIGYCLINEIYNARIEDTDTSFIYFYDGYTYELPKNESTKTTYYSYPYFGGQKVAPHKITIAIWY